MFTSNTLRVELMLVKCAALCLDIVSATYRGAGSIWFGSWSKLESQFQGNCQFYAFGNPLVLLEIPDPSFPCGEFGDLKKIENRSCRDTVLATSSMLRHNTPNWKERFILIHHVNPWSAGPKPKAEWQRAWQKKRCSAMAARKQGEKEEAQDTKVAYLPLEPTS